MLSQDLHSKRGKKVDLRHGTVRMDAPRESKAAAASILPFPGLDISRRFYLSSAIPTARVSSPHTISFAKAKTYVSSYLFVSAQKSPQVPAVAWNPFSCMSPKQRVVAASSGFCAPTVPGPCFAECSAVAQMSHRSHMDAQKNAVCTGWYTLQTP